MFSFDYVMQQTATEHAAIEYCFKIGLFHSECMCSKCDKPMKKSMSDDVKKCRWRCGRKGCNTEKSFRAGSFFGKSKLSVKTLVRLLFMWSARTPVTEAAEHAQTSVKTAIDWYSFCRDVCSAEMKQIPMMVSTGIFRFMLSVLYICVYMIYTLF
jgi:hypothetical protein